MLHGYHLTSLSILFGVKQATGAISSDGFVIWDGLGLLFCLCLFTFRF